MPNRLASETSPYLLQHANNPVDWYPWGAEALERARRENRPILLSIGYAACHWCHVMEHESFEDRATADFMNERFVCIKVDREERPDIDGIYMQAVQAMTGHGGWPMTMFLTPDGVPFFGGTYFPKSDRPGLPSFSRILYSVAEAYRTKPDDVGRSVEQVRAMYAASAEPMKSGGPLSARLFDDAYRAIADRYDAEHGGFGRAPKFPQTMALDFLLRHATRRRVEEAREIVVQSFRHMARGGIYDQVGGGFARYAVDALWLVPHFEKMLYDNALLARLGVHLWQATGDGEVRRVTRETIDWVAREMTSPEGGFYASYDADSEGHEGTFYLWTNAEIDQLLGDDATVAKTYWAVTPDGNFEGKTILSIPEDPDLVARRLGIARETLERVIAGAKRKLYDARSRRPHPGLDDKILTSWNALMLRTVAEAARAFGDPEYQALALRNANFLFDASLRDGRVLRSAKRGSALAGYLEDHAALGLAALAVYELTFDTRWLHHARELSRTMVQWYWDETAQTFFDTASDHETLITRPREVTDNAVPAGTSLAAELLVRIAELFDDDADRARATHVVETLAPMIARYPLAFGYLLGAADLLVNGAMELAIVGDPAADDFKALERVVAERYLPSLVLAGGVDGDEVALLKDRPREPGGATAYLCRNYTCDAPATSAEMLEQQLDAAASA